jgi:hypothetical protein
MGVGRVDGINDNPPLMTNVLPRDATALARTCEKLGMPWYMYPWQVTYSRIAFCQRGRIRIGQYWTFCPRQTLHLTKDVLAIPDCPDTCILVAA